MMNTIFAVLALVPAVQDDAYKGLATGDRVEVTFRNGNTLTGSLTAPPRLQTAPKRRSGRPEAGGAPFYLFVFVEGEGGESASQVAAVEAWRKRFPEAAVRRIPRGQEQALWDRHQVKSIPSLVFEVPGGKAIQFPGFHSEDRLDDALLKFRAGAEGDGIDYSRENSITIDLSLEYPGLDGTMSVPKSEIRNLRKLQNLDEATLKRLTEEKKRVKDEMLKEELQRRQEESGRAQRADAEASAEAKARADAEAAKNELKAAVDKADRIQKGMALLKKFPPPTWGPEKVAEIARKAQLRIPVTPEEREFSENVQLWGEAMRYQQEKEKEKGGNN
jgi:hypothetical protein